MSQATQDNPPVLGVVCPALGVVCPTFERSLHDGSPPYRQVQRADQFCRGLQTQLALMGQLPVLALTSSRRTALPAWMAAETGAALRRSRSRTWRRSSFNRQRCG